MPVEDGLCKMLPLCTLSVVSFELHVFNFTFFVYLILNIDAVTRPGGSGREPSAIGKQALTETLLWIMCL